MIRYFNIYFDGIDGYDEWLDYEVENMHRSFNDEQIMIEDVKFNLKELGGGHADIFDAITDELYAEIEV